MAYTRDISGSRNKTIQDKTTITDPEATASSRLSWPWSDAQFTLTLQAHEDARFPTHGRVRAAVRGDRIFFTYEQTSHPFKLDIN